MATKVHTGTQAAVTAASLITINSPSATLGNKLILPIAWIDTSSPGAAKTPTTPVGWSVAYSVASAFGASGAVGLSFYYKTAAGGVESPVFNTPGSAGGLFANGIITEWSGMGAFDAAASASSVLINNAAGSTTGATIPNTGTLANANSTIFTGISILSGSGINPAGIAFSGGAWTQEFKDDDTTSSVGTIVGDKVVSLATALNAVFGWTLDATMQAFQAAIVVFSDAAPAGGALEESEWQPQEPQTNPLVVSAW